jgi:ADP-heptose:LPS heptosyltransferase
LNFFRREVKPSHVENPDKISARLGLNGDVVQLSVVLKHLRKYRPNDTVDVVCGRGKHTALIGLCNRVFHDGEIDPEDKNYTIVNQLGWFEDMNHYRDRPNSKISNNMQEVFHLDWDESLARYECHRSPESDMTACKYLESIGCKRQAINGSRCIYNSVILHYHGNTSPTRKNLNDWQIKPVCELIIKAGRVPVILDWDHRSHLPDNQRIFNPPTGDGDIWGGFGSGDASVVASLIQNSEAFIGIDSGPGKIASATDTPTLICWTGHHPMQFHDPAPNTLHLIPENHKGMTPLDNREDIFQCFNKYYQYTTYQDNKYDLIYQVQKWLGKLLGCEPEIETMKYVTPNGIGDVIWVLHKIKAINAEVNNGGPIDIILSGNPSNPIDYRSTHFLKRFPFIRSAEVVDVPVLRDKENVSDEKGRYRYEKDGLQGNHYFLCANSPLEKGERLESWMPEYPIDWSIIDDFDWSDTEKGRDKGKELNKFVALYLGPETGNVDEGHARQFVWEPRQWVELAERFKERGCKIALVGADYDRSYYERYVKCKETSDWIDLIGKFEIGETFAFLKESKVFVSYQCGLMIVLSYMGGRCVSWWRAVNDSIHPRRFISFSEDMSTAWVNPKYRENYIPCIYKRETVSDIVSQIDEKGWLK